MRKSCLPLAFFLTILALVILHRSLPHVPSLSRNWEEAFGTTDDEGKDYEIIWLTKDEAYLLQRGDDGAHSVILRRSVFDKKFGKVTCKVRQ